MKSILSKKVDSSKKTLGRTLAVDIRRAVYSTRFLMSVALMLFWLAFNAVQSIESYDRAASLGVPMILKIAMTAEFSTGPVLLAIATIPYAFSYLTEHESGYEQQIVERVGRQTYSISKAVSTFLSGFFMGVVAIGIFIAILSTMGITHAVRYEQVEGTYAVLAAKNPGWYYTIMLVAIGLVCGQAAVFSLMIMGWVPNAYVGFMSPLIGYYIIECIEFLAARHIYNPYFWRKILVSEVLFGQPGGNLLFSYLWKIFLLLSFTLVFGMSFIIHFEKGREQ